MDAIEAAMRDRESEETLAVAYRQQANDLRDEYYLFRSRGQHDEAHGLNVARYLMIGCAARLERVLRGLAYR